MSRHSSVSALVKELIQFKRSDNKKGKDDMKEKKAKAKQKEKTHLQSNLISMTHRQWINSFFLISHYKNVF